MPFDLMAVLAKPQHTAERKQYVCEALANELHEVLVKSKRRRSAEFERPYFDLIRGGGEIYINLLDEDLKRLGIALRPDEGDNSTLIDWIQSEVGSMLTRLFVGDDNFTSSWVTVYPEEDVSDGKLRLHLVRNENRASDGE